jgi:hypothetical protein
MRASKGAVMDKFDALVEDAQLCVGVLANRDVTDIELIPLKGVPHADYTAEGLKRQFAGRDLHFIATAGLVNGEPRIALDEPLDTFRIAALFAAFATYCDVLQEERLEQARKGDEVNWLRRLASLKDPRTPA